MIIKEIKKNSDYQKLLLEILNYKSAIGLFGLSKTARASFLAALNDDTQREILVITKDERSANKLYEDLSFFTNSAELFLSRDLNLRYLESFSREYEYKRIKTLGRIIAKKAKIIIAPVNSALMYTMPKEKFLENTFTIKDTQKLNQEDLMQKLIKSGYIRRDMVEGFGQFAKRGDIIDIFSPDMQNPVRIEFWGDEIDRMNSFDIITQRRIEGVKKIHISPTKEVLFFETKTALDAINSAANLLSSKQKELFLKASEKEFIMLNEGVIPQSMDKFISLCYKEKETVLNYLENPLIVFDDFINVKESYETFNWQYNEDVKQLFEENVLAKGLDEFYLSFAKLQNKTNDIPSIITEDFVRSTDGLPLSSIINITCNLTPIWNGEYDLLLDDLQFLTKQGYKVCVLAGTEKNAKTLAGDLSSKGISAGYIKNTGDVNYGAVGVMAGHTSAGFNLPSHKFALITSKKLNVSSNKKTRAKNKDAIISLEEISKGDYVVHQNYGVGVYDGIHTVSMQGVTKDYLKISYLGKDTLFVPVTQLDLISRYNISGNDEKVKISKLSSDTWNKTKQRAKKATSEMAKELIQLYAQRQKAKGFQFMPDTEWQRDFEARFMYEETDDQLTSIREIKKDMQSSFPMDRLLCGDVGVGKTEVAIRAAFKAVMDSKQVAILVPTTVLAWQHFNTFMERMESFPINIQLLSRFRTPKQRNQTIKDINNGVADIVIGTHALIQKSVNFKNLGLVIIDEEQRFGVAHKEKLVESFKGVDVLTLSATPIPRTLSMAMNGIRDMSTIEQPPIDRIPIETYVSEYDEKIIKAALQREINRSGQCYYLHNRVETIEMCANKVRSMVPDAVVAVAHGKMDEQTLSGVWRSLINGEVDILVCTTIIETGIDVPNCNTLIIEDADTMGLSQLYQIRGRVGRSTRKSYAYFTFRRSKVLNEIAVKRLNAIKEFTSFGSGFRIAMRDLEIRGAGSVLGKTQSGFLMSIGYDLYIKLLNQAIALEKGLPIETEKSDCIIDISVDAFIPEKYIPSAQNRIESYKKIAVLETDEEVSDLIDELIDRYGDVPSSVMGLIDVSRIRVISAKLGIKEIVQRKDNLVLYSDTFEKIDVVEFLKDTQHKVLVNSQNKPYLSISIPKDENSLKFMKELILELQKYSKK